MEERFMPTMRVQRILLAFGILVAAAVPGTADPEVRLVSHVEPRNGSAPAVVGPNEPINPASVVKVATSLWALAELGPDHRFETRFGIRGTLDPQSGYLDGDLIVVGGGDPDFHIENAYLVMRYLNRMGVRQVGGSLRVTDEFWIGWEGGSEKREKDPLKRTLSMASRLRDAFDPARWTAAEQKGMSEFAARKGVSLDDGRAIVIHGGVNFGNERDVERMLVVHRSNHLVQILKRLNAYSNNDIERLSVALGSPEQLAEFLAARWKIDVEGLRFETLSGLGKNRLTPRLIVRLLQDLESEAARHELTSADLLPVAGCDPGTLENFPSLETNGMTGALIAKTGTLEKTDGGVSVLAGFLTTGQGPVVFAVAAPRAGKSLPRARDEQARWVLELARSYDGPLAGECGPELPYSDSNARVQMTR